MICLKRNKRPLFLCQKIEGTTKFDKPKKFYLNYQPTNSIGDVLTMGQDYSMYLRIKCTLKEAKHFENGDKCYVFTNPPKEYDAMCKKADYIVEGNPLLTLNEAEIKLRKLSGNK